MLRRLTAYWRSARNETLTGAALLAIVTSVDLLQPLPIKWLVDYVFGNHAAPAWLVSLWPAFGVRDAAGGIAAVSAGISEALVTLATSTSICKLPPTVKFSGGRAR